jgi:hypothetical protein
LTFYGSVYIQVSPANTKLYFLKPETIFTERGILLTFSQPFRTSRIGGGLEKITRYESSPSQLKPE